MNGERSTPSASVVGRLPCLACGYNLNGQPVDGQCPECGAGVAESLGSAFFWPFDRIATTRRGLLLLILAAPIGALVYLGASLIARVPDTLSALGVRCVMCVGPFLAWRGCVLLARVFEAMGSSAPPTRCSSSMTRKLAAWFAWSFALTFAVETILDPPGLRAHQAMISSILTIMTGWLWCLRNVMLLPWLGRIAHLSGAPRLAALARALQLGPGLCAGAITLRYAIQAASREDPPVGTALRIIVCAWIVVWPLFLLSLWHHLRKLERDAVRSGGTRLVDGPALGDTRAIVPPSLR